MTQKIQITIGSPAVSDLKVAIGLTIEKFEKEVLTDKAKQFYTGLTQLLKKKTGLTSDEVEEDDDIKVLFDDDLEDDEEDEQDWERDDDEDEDDFDLDLKYK